MLIGQVCECLDVYSRTTYVDHMLYGSLEFHVIDPSYLYCSYFQSIALHNRSDRSQIFGRMVSGSCSDMAGHTQAQSNRQNTLKINNMPVILTLRPICNDLVLF